MHTVALQWCHKAGEASGPTHVMVTREACNKKMVLGEGDDEIVEPTRQPC